MFQLKNYQNKALTILTTYLQKARIMGAIPAYNEILGENAKYHAINGLEEIPYVCLRLPTGGGKTFLSAHSIKIAAQNYVEKDYPMVLWLTPSSTIKEQTIATLKNPTHPNREILDNAFNGNVAIFDIDDFATIRPHDIANKVCVFVSTIQSFNVKNTDIRNIYAHNENLEPHFVNITSNTDALERIEADKEGAGKIKNSFANLLHINNPIVIVDEAHKAVTDLNREMMNRINPACIIEFTATPNEKESNVLHRTSALELKTEEMIKLPIILAEHQTWQQSITAACLMQNKLMQSAKLEKEYIRPIILIQAENKNLEVTEEVIKKYLIENEKVASESIAIATGEKNELEGINVLDPNCPVNIIITKQALREGWDCSFAYIFCSVAKVHSLTSVEQFLGRVLRMPYAKKREQDILNKAYAFVSSEYWVNAVGKLKDSLVNMGFDEQESTKFIEPQKDNLNLTFNFTASKMKTDSLTEEEKKEVELKELPTGQVEIKIKINTPEAIKNKIKTLIPAQEVKIFENTCNIVTKKEKSFAEKGEKFEVPQLCLFVDDDWKIVNDREYFLPEGWKLLDYPAELTETEFAIRQDGNLIAIDIDGKKVTERFLNNLFTTADIDAGESNWSNLELSRWLDREINQWDISQPVLLEFLRRMVEYLTVQRKININSLVRTKFLLAKAISEKINKYREDAYKKGFQQVLFKTGETKVDFDFTFSFTEAYPANLKYNGSIVFNKHFHNFVGNMNNEEALCAQVIDSLPEVKFWIRNIERTISSFSLPTSTDRFYPDFVALLNDGRLLAVEYKGEHLITNEDTKEKENIGNLWAEKSNGKCLFAMVGKENYKEVLTKIVKS